MRDSLLLTLLYPESGAAPVTLVWAVLVAIVVVGRKKRWTRYVWLPVFCVSLFFSISVVGMLIAGGWALLGLVAWGLFPVLAITLFFCRPPGLLSEPRPLFVGFGFACLVSALLYLTPRPGVLELRLKFVETDGQPVAGAAFPLFTYHGRGGNHDGVLRTASDGTVRFKVYYPESGTITLHDPQDPRRDRQVKFEPWTPIVGGVTNGYRFDGKVVVAGNTEQVATISWHGKRDLAARRTEPMLTYSRTITVAVPQENPRLDVAKGKFGPEGDLIFVMQTGPGWLGGPDIRLKVMAVDAAGIARSDEQYMDIAPEAGYLNQTEFVLLAGDPHYAGRLEYRFYVRTRSGEFGVVSGDVSVSRRGNQQEAYLYVSIRCTPGGSRHVEFDHTKWLNRDQL